MKLNTLAHRAFLALVLWAAVSSAFAQFAPNRYALILEDPPAASRVTSRASLQSTDVRDYRQQVEARQGVLRSELANRNVTVTGSVSTLLNAVFVVAPPDRVEELRSLPGVKALVPLRRYKMNLNRATQLVNAPAAWSALGGIQNSGTGIKIGILDTGIDQTHPAFQDSSLSIPAGFPRCNPGADSDCRDFTNNKVIVARSYVRMLAAGTSPSNPAADSRPDDYSARDHEGHGTAVASCAAAVTNTGRVTFSGVAPKAYLGSYKIIGSPQVNDFSSEDVIIQALDDAVNDGMDIVSFSIGSAAFTGAVDTGAACGLPGGVACDLSALAFENAGKAEVTIVVAAGNTGQDGNQYPSYNTISSPAHAPSVIAVGATSNSHFFAETVSVPGSGVPAGLQNMVAAFGDALIPVDPMTAPLVDVTRLGNDGLACSALPAGSLNGSFALILRGTCFFVDKVTNAVAAGAAGVIFYNSPGSDFVSPAGLTSFSIPVVMISDTDGAALKSFIAANPGRAVTIDPVGERVWPTPNQLIGFSARGPSTGDSSVKPEVVAPGVDMYMAAENFDPLGILYDPSRYAVANGTSFSTPLVSGAAALVKQRHPGFTPAQVKSALVNAASQDVTTDESATPLPVDVRDIGAGKLDVAAAINATVTAAPSTISFGPLRSGSLPAMRQIILTNSGAGAVTLAMAVVAGTQSSGPVPTLSVQSLPLAAGASGTVTLTLAGSIPQFGAYSGALTVQAAGVSLRIPYMYLVGTGNAFDLIPLSGDNFSGTVGQPIPEGIVGFKLVDSVGVPVSGVAVSWSSSGTATLLKRVSATDAYGIATAEPVLGQTPGNYSFTAAAGGQSHTFSGSARLAPRIATGGVVDAASFSSGRAVAPGSYISIFGAGLSESIGIVPTDSLPLAMDFVTVSFDVPSAGISLPGRMVYISPSQINVQVPWELQGQSAAQVKVTIDFSPGNVLTVPLANYAPAFFEIAAGKAAAVDGNDQIITSANPARGGSTVYLFLNGLGPVTNQPASGNPALNSPLSDTTTTPVVTIGGRQATNVHAFLTPTLPGLYQITATVPSGLTAGTQPISVTIGGKTSPNSGLPVQ